MSLLKVILHKKKLKHKYNDSLDEKSSQSPMHYFKRGHINELNVKVRLLDDVQKPLNVKLSVNDIGKVLFTTVCEKIGNLAQCDYFGLRFVDKYGERQWLDLEKPVLKQVKDCKAFLFSFRVKHYPLHPLEDIKEELTRYMLYLQIRRDLARGRLLCPQNLLSCIGANILQAEFGDALSKKSEQWSIPTFAPSCVSTLAIEKNAKQKPTGLNTSGEEYKGHNENMATDFIKNIRIFKDQTAQMTALISDHHQSLRGITENEAENEVLRLVSQLATYGIDKFDVYPIHKVIIPKPSSKSALSVVSDAEPFTISATEGMIQEQPKVLSKDTPFYLGISGRGIITFVGLQQCEIFPWNQIQRFDCDGKQFSIRLQKQKKKGAKISYQCRSKAAALAIWRWAIDRKYFFTLKEASQAKVRTTRHLFHRSHTFKFSGRSQYELSKLQVSNGTKDIVRVSSLRGAASNRPRLSDHQLFLPSPPRLPLTLNEVKDAEPRPAETADGTEPETEPKTEEQEPNELVDNSADTANETAVPETDLSSSLQTTVNSDSDANHVTKIVQEVEIEAKAVSTEAAAPEISASMDILHTKATEYEECSDSSHMEILDFHNVVSALDRTIESYSEHDHQTTVGAQLHTVNGDVRKTEKLVNSDPTNNSEKCTDSSLGKLSLGDNSEKASGSFELGATKVTISIVTVLLITGVIVTVENSQLRAMVDPNMLRHTQLFSSFESYIYNPVRDTINKLLNMVW